MATPELSCAYVVKLFTRNSGPRRFCADAGSASTARAQPRARRARIIRLASSGRDDGPECSKVNGARRRPAPRMRRRCELDQCSACSIQLMSPTVLTGEIEDRAVPFMSQTYV